MYNGYQVSSLERSVAYLPFSRLCYWNTSPRKFVAGPPDERATETISALPAPQERITDWRGLTMPLEQRT
jgi:hypothetical protein